MSLLLRTFCFLWLVTLPVSVQAAPDTDKLKARWESLTPEQREKARSNFKRWKSMDSTQRDNVKKAYRRFKSLPASRQAKIRRNFQKFKSLSPERRQKIRERFKKFRSMPKEKRQPANAKTATDAKESQWWAQERANEKPEGLQ